MRHAGLLADTGAASALPLLGQALACVAHPAIRNRGTTVGSIAHADAAGEMPSVAVLTGAVIEAASVRGTREIAATDFFEGPLETTLEADEVVVAVRFGRFPTGTRTAFLEAARRHGDYAMAGVAVALGVTDGVVSDARASFVSVTPVPDILDLTEAVRGREPGTVDWSTVADAVAAHVDPEADIHASADYRRALVIELTQRAFAAAAQEGVA